MTIKEVSEKYGLTAETLRYYERIGLIPRVNRRDNGIRDYTEENCRWVEFAKCMRSAGVQVESVIEYVKLFHQGDSTRMARKQILEEERERLLEKKAEIEATLERLNKKIEGYGECCICK